MKTLKKIAFPALLLVCSTTLFNCTTDKEDLSATLETNSSNTILATTRIQAEDYNSNSGVRTQTTSDTDGEDNVGWINNGDWIMFESIDLTNNITSFAARVASNTNGGALELRLDSADGDIIGQIDISNTSGWQTWETLTTSNLSFNQGTHDLYLVFRGGSGYLFNINWFEFIVEDEDTTLLNTSLFSEFSRVSDFELVDCTLSDGTETQCYRVVYENIRETVTTICPEYATDEDGGLGVYTGADGITGEGIRALDSQLWADFATDGYDIINDDGTINIQIPAGGPGSGFIEPGSGINGSCLDAILDDSYLITYYIPAYPVKTDRQSSTRARAYWGISLDGFPFAEQPPSSASGMGVAIPGLDTCGGHPQPDGPYHYHLIPQVIDDLLDKEGIDKTCGYIAQSSNSILGYARDGFPMYGFEDTDGTIPTDLDQCQGHTHANDDFAEETYHYHITNVIDPNSDAGYTNTLPCTFGATVTSADFAGVTISEQ